MKPLSTEWSPKICAYFSSDLSATKSSLTPNSLAIPRHPTSFATFALVLKSPPCLLWVFISSTWSFKNTIYPISISLTLKGKNKNWILLKGSMAITFTSICISFTAFYLFYIILFNRLWTLHKERKFYLIPFVSPQSRIVTRIFFSVILNRY